MAWLTAEQSRQHPIVSLERKTRGCSNIYTKIVSQGESVGDGGSRVWRTVYQDYQDIEEKVESATVYPAMSHSEARRLQDQMLSERLEGASGTPAATYITSDGRVITVPAVPASATVEIERQNNAGAWQLVVEEDPVITKTTVNVGDPRIEETPIEE